MNVTTQYTLPIDAQNVDLEEVGGKGHSLAQMAGTGLRVPGGFHLTTAAYRRFVEVNDLQGPIVGSVRPDAGGGDALLRCRIESDPGIDPKAGFAEGDSGRNPGRIHGSGRR